MAKLLKLKKHWYLLDGNIEIIEGSPVVYDGLLPVFASFVD